MINAAVHADSSEGGAPISVSVFFDRIEMENPKLLPFGLTLDDIQGEASRAMNGIRAMYASRFGPMPFHATRAS